MFLKLVCLVFFSISLRSNAEQQQEYEDFVILFLSQPHAYLLSKLHNSTLLIRSQQDELIQKYPNIRLSMTNSHDYASKVTNWYTIYPIFSTLLTKYSHLKFLFVCEIETRIDLIKLVDYSRTLANLSFVGHALYDTEPSIIHHYSFSKKAYPDPAAGILFSRQLLTTFIDKLPSHSNKIDFIIDIKYELVDIIEQLTSIKYLDQSNLFCNQHRPSLPSSCLTWNDWSIYNCQSSHIRLNHLYFGIKTFFDYHHKRVSLLKKTWLKNNLNYNLFSNKYDSSLKNILVLDGENTVYGHCHKTFSILKYFNNSVDTRQKYLIIVDDDTLLSVTRLLSLIQCFMLNDDVPVILGERYGYGSYDYPTAGSGIIFNRPTVELLIENCLCPQPDTPDDMFIGICLKRLKIRILHVNEFHQAQTTAYSNDWLKHQQPISFHKFENIDVEQTYKMYLEDKIIDNQNIEL
ncbi:unnamed protein product [Didymodactylos carnosus]|uniref:Fringe-like glycosyltransferase domain-containing protein n=1 Tax=Didymodactylos carnosus TaxID=1234261 RepID=A0A814GPY2_9BILA|nr:unnamed protein product [Didymodactylos carnosus]CAF1189549.1 unnamed protein product [Didymodactylos carnosus]CAF3771098.1 unnamed protein product [Didymodactylos carnosus]CAF4000593.1 unnamed protein product [Didymodactylos carnosus]